jgi:hypothetical protein
LSVACIMPPLQVSSFGTETQRAVQSLFTVFVKFY